MVIQRQITARGTIVHSMTYWAPVGANNVFNEMNVDQIFLQSIPIRPVFVILLRKVSLVIKCSWIRSSSLWDSNFSPIITLLINFQQKIKWLTSTDQSAHPKYMRTPHWGGYSEILKCLRRLCEKVTIGANKSTIPQTTHVFQIILTLVKVKAVAE